MVYSITNSYSATLALLFLFSLFLTPYAITSAQFADVCTHTIEPPFCSNYLNSIPGVFTATFKDLSQRVATDQQSAAKRTIDQINQLRLQVKNPHEDQILVSCLQNYTQLQQQMATCLSSIASGSSGPAILAASVSIRLARNCQDAIGGTPGIPRVLTTNNNRSEDISSILVQLTQHL